MVVGGVGIHKGDGGLAEPKARPPQEDCQSCGPGESLAQEKAEVPKKTTARCGSPERSVNGDDEEINFVDGHYVPVCDRPGVVLHVDDAKHCNDLFGKQISFASWCSQMVASVFRTRTSFAAFARSAIHLTRDNVVSKSPAFLVPLFALRFVASPTIQVPFSSCCCSYGFGPELLVER